AVDARLDGLDELLRLLPARQREGRVRELTRLEVALLRRAAAERRPPEAGEVGLDPGAGSRARAFALGGEVDARDDPRGDAALAQLGDDLLVLGAALVEARDRSGQRAD